MQKIFLIFLVSLELMRLDKPAGAWGARISCPRSGIIPISPEWRSQSVQPRLQWAVASSVQDSVMRIARQWENPLKPTFRMSNSLGCTIETITKIQARWWLYLWFPHILNNEEMDTFLWTVTHWYSNQYAFLKYALQGRVKQENHNDFVPMRNDESRLFFWGLF